jgi:DNA-binding transcriptional MerR regulator
VTDYQHLRPPGTMSSTEVCKLVGITYRRLNHWIIQGYIEGQGRQGPGTIRAWTPEQVARVEEIHAALEGAKALLLAAGLSIHGIGANQ